MPVRREAIDTQQQTTMPESDAVGRNDHKHDYDWVIVGSGFGGSVSALRLAEKGYRVAVLEGGRRFEDRDFAASTWNLRRYMWMPFLGLRGILRLTPFRDTFIGSGAAPNSAPTTTLRNACWG
jgi:hypothetical protein